MMTDEEKMPRIAAIVAERIAAVKRGDNFASRTGGRTADILPCIVCGDPVPQGRAVKPRLMCGACYTMFLHEYKLAYDREIRRERHGASHCCKRACKYCGSRVHVRKSGYCAECISAGFDDLHKFTGRTNGWDAKPKAKPVPVVAGWRGRPCAGCGSRNFTQFELSLKDTPSADAVSKALEKRQRREKYRRWKARQEAKAAAENNLAERQEEEQN